MKQVFIRLPQESILNVNYADFRNYYNFFIQYRAE